MIEKNIIKIAKTLGDITNAKRVILFGSYARGDANENSDVDLLIVADSQLPRFKRTRDLYKRIRPYLFGIDFLVYTPQEIAKGEESPLSFGNYTYSGTRCRIFKRFFSNTYAVCG